MIIFLITFILFSFYAFLNIDTLQDSNLFTPAVHAARGLVLFRDTFFQYGALVSFLHAFVIKLFGEYLIAIRLLNVLFYAATAVLLYHIWSRFLSKTLTVLSIVLWLSLWPFFDEILLPWSSVYALVFQNIAFLSLLIFIEKRKNMFLLIAGISTALTFWARQPVGVFLFLAIFVFFIFSFPIRKIFYFIAGLFIVSIPFLAYFLKNNALHDFWLQSFVFARAYAVVIRGISIEQVIKSLFIGRYWKDHTYHLHYLWLVIPISSIYLFTKPKSRKLFFAGLICLASWMQYYPMTEPEHFFWADSPIIGFFILTIYELFVRKKQKLQKVFSYGLGLIVFVFLIIRITVSIPRFVNATTYSSTLPFLRYIRLTPYEALTLDRFQNLLIKNIPENRSYINYSDDMMIPLLDKRFHTFGPLYLNWDLITNNMYRDYESKVKKYVNDSHPVIVTRTTPYIANYCSLANVSYLQPDMAIHIDSRRVLNAELIDNNLSLRFLRNTEIADIQQIQTTSNSLAISDRKKINLIPLSRNISHERPMWIVVFFKRGDIKNCTLYFK